MARDPDTRHELGEEIDLESPKTMRDVVIQTYSIVQQILVRMDEMNARMDRMNARMDRMEDRTDKRFLWLTGIVLTTWMTLLATILVKL